MSKNVVIFIGVLMVISVILLAFFLSSTVESTVPAETLTERLQNCVNDSAVYDDTEKYTEKCGNSPIVEVYRNITGQ